MKSTTMKRTLIWSFSIFILSVFVSFPITSLAIRAAEKSYQEALQALPNWISVEWGKGVCGDMLIDGLGKLWMACGDGISVWDGAKVSFVQYPFTNISRDIQDFTVDVRGSPWIISSGSQESFVSVYVDQNWKTYSQEDFGISANKWEPDGIEVDRDGKVWVGAYNSDAGIGGLLAFENNIWRLLQYDEIGLPGNSHATIKSDFGARLWLAYDDRGLYTFDGISSKQIIYEGESLRNISDMTFDKDGNLWVIDGCGNVGGYENTTWTTYPKHENGSTLNSEPHCVDDYRILVDPSKRIWAWRLYSGQIWKFDKGTWLTLTEENSGFSGHLIFGLIVDNLDRVWISTIDGLSMIPVEDIQVIPENVVGGRHQAIFWGSAPGQLFHIFLPIILAYFWIWVFLNLNVWRKNLPSETDTEFAQRTKRLAKISLVIGNLSYGLMCLFVSVIVWMAGGLMDPSGGYDSGIMGVAMLAIVLVIPILSLSLAGFVVGRIGIKKIGAEGLQIDNTVREVARRGALLGALSLSLYLISVYSLLSL